MRYPSKFNRKKQREIKINSPEFEILGYVKANAKDIDVPDAFSSGCNINSAGRIVVLPHLLNIFKFIYLVS